MMVSKQLSAGFINATLSVLRRNCDASPLVNGNVDALNSQCADGQLLLF
jgi:hypothetical protein